MIFWLKSKNPIQLNQLVKALGLIDDYKEIRFEITKGLFKLNGKEVYNQRQEIYAGDTIEYNNDYIYVKFREKHKPEKKYPKIQHGKVKNWYHKPIKHDLDLKISRISQRVDNKIKKLKKTLSVAESCTGGMLQEKITENAGCSTYFKGGVVCYSNKSKEEMLSIEPNILEKHGAVSEETVKRMITGLRKIFQTNYYIAITGLAGPAGGTAEKPIGTVFIAVGLENIVKPKKYMFEGNRNEIRKKAVLEAFKSLERVI